ncbi:MAG TPA: 2-oxoglutarate dehydrogenase E1 component [Gemmatimonadaceae bacterium]|nr:2-oxoglutarate dehydrogenase E1 component [Gemmatimonadaceae bacterium]
MSDPITSVFNDGYIAEQFEAYRRDPASVDESWRQFFRFAEGLAGVVARPADGTAAAPELLRKVAGAAALVDAIRNYGHLAVPVDPLGSPPPGAAELAPEFHGITEADLQLVPAEALGFGNGTAADVVARLRLLYSSRLALESEYLEEEAEREWFRQIVEQGDLLAPLGPDEKKSILRRLTEVDGLERFLGRAYLGMKRFSIEGTDALIPMLDAAMEESAALGTREVVIGMAHRGRINVLTHTLGKPHATIFGEFEGKHADSNAESGTGDVKYHLGYRGERETRSGGPVSVQLLPNPSHLEFVDPVVMGVARAKQRARDETHVLPVVIHGDAAFAAEGVVAETINLSRLRGYRVGGTLHIITNNQIGFTTDPLDGRSTFYASDMAKGFEVPIVHVNADDAEACILAVRLAIAYRRRFQKDFLIDLVGYRRHGHNETDEPSFTQPKLYALIRQHPSPREVWGQRLVDDGVVTHEEVEALDAEIQARLGEIHDAVKAGLHTPEHESTKPQSAPPPEPCDSTVPADDLIALNERLLEWPEGFAVHPRLAKTLERRRTAITEKREDGGGSIDWGHAEALAFASLLVDGTSVRMSGQDIERGTFSHRQAVLHDIETGAIHIPLQHIPGARGQYEIYNSPLSETAVMGFEYGYSTAADDTLVLWEAQFGDFVNVAQPIIDQFLVADRAKWGQDSGLVLLLPHGYEGQGPEHSSARLERFLQLAAEGNVVVAYPTTPAQYFHVLRRQAKQHEQRPLVLMTPKSLLRLPEAASSLEDLSTGCFVPVFDDARAAQRREEVRRIVVCTGKIYYDLMAAGPSSEIAIIRVEELYPWPREALGRIVDLYPAWEEVVWAQEEPKNMGAWSHAAPRLRATIGNAPVIRYVGRPERASPAEGYSAAHTAEQKRIVAEVLAPSLSPAGKRREAKARA